jgi:hypothetical protein
VVDKLSSFSLITTKIKMNLKYTFCVHFLTI